MRIKMIDIEGTRVQVYWNLHKECWSVVALQGEHKGRVVKHTDSIVIKAATFVVQPAGRERVRREGKKNVHAFVRGTVSLIGELVEFMMVDGGVMENRPVTYNPYKFDTFVFADNQEPVFASKNVALLGPRNVLAEV